MSRSGYVDDFDYDGGQWDIIRWRGAVKAAIKGKRGQALLREMLEAFDVLPDKRLIKNELQEPDGEVCALGAVGLRRGMDMSTIDPEDQDAVAEQFGIAVALAAEIMWENDDGGYHETPEQRWERMRKWVQSKLVK